MSTTAKSTAPLSSLLVARLCTTVLLAIAALVASPAVAWEFDFNPNQTTDVTAPWEQNEDWIVRALTEGVVLRTEPIGTGVTNPFKAELEFEEHRLSAVWKPLRTTDFDTYESYPAEIAAYRLSKYLGLDMVPPTVRRKIGRRWGSLQLWVDGHRSFADAAATRPFDFEHSDQWQLMRFFDALIDNPDRNAGNFLVDEQYRIVLIDHSRAFNFAATERQRKGPMPTRFQASVIERLKAIDLDLLDEMLDGILMRGDRRSLNLSAKRLVKFVEQQVSLLGSGIVFEQPKPAVPAPIAITQSGLNGTDEP